MPRLPRRCNGLMQAAGLSYIRILSEAVFNVTVCEVIYVIGSVNVMNKMQLC